MYKLGVATKALKPPHEYTPWVTVNDVHSDEAQESLESFLCSGILKGAPECHGPNTAISDSSVKKCYREDAPVPSVSIEVYYEALCGGCVGFITQELHPTYRQLKKYLNVQFYPYGNTRISKTPDPYGNMLDTITICIKKHYHQLTCNIYQN